MATLDALSEGRLTVGVGLGSQAWEEFAAFGEDPDPRRRHELIDEGLDIVCGLWTGEPFSYEGHHYRVAESLFLPPPIQRPRPPIWIGGRWPARRSFRRAGRFDGVFPTFDGVDSTERPTREQLQEVVEFTQGHRDGEGAEFDIVMGASRPARITSCSACTRRSASRGGSRSSGGFVVRPTSRADGSSKDRPRASGTPV